MPPKKKLDDSMITQDAVEYADQFDFKNQLLSASMACAAAGIEDLMDNFKKELDLKKLLKIIPDYNAEYCIETAYQVNDVAIKSYDIKKDDAIIFDKETFIEDNEEPSGPGKDPFKIDQIVRNVREIQEPSENEFNHSISNSSVSSIKKEKKFGRTSSILKVNTKASYDRMMDGLKLGLNSAVTDQLSRTNGSPLSRRP